MNGFKKSLSTVLAVGLVTTSLAATGFAAEKSDTQSTQTSRNLYTANNEFLGTVTTNTTITLSKEGQDTLFTVTKTNDYTLEPKYSSIKEYQAEFADGTETRNYRLTKNKEIYVDGELLETGEDNSNALSSGITALNATGGVAAYSHYYSTSDYKKFTFATYSDVDFAADSDNLKASGSHVSKTVAPTVTFFDSARSNIDMFSNDYTAYQAALASLAVALGTTIVTWGTVVGALAGGAASAAAAGVAIDQFNSMETHIGQAYGYVNNM
ncbi:hypothetical protein FHS18_005563 [Paenibacillus phyllosphaerae]|uniref:Uncharacterized protein n=1 Tax=Paenibacillus phyllosphaerae TaxID=274593 RepID=A0A7W5B4B2_9BACL|nr:hypothetical protein [Paenibacillus phyllosphaerae]MBB3113451.1 hypothetical protein [Paenibacillus phyllosphaerae]